MGSVWAICVDNSYKSAAAFRKGYRFYNLTVGKKYRIGKAKRKGYCKVKNDSGELKTYPNSFFGLKYKEV